MRKVAKVTALALCCALAFSMTGCNLGKKAPKVGGSTTSADTNTSGNITVYTSMPQDQTDRYLAVFKKEYPKVNVTIVRDTAWNLAQKVIKEKGAPVADVIWHTPLSAVYASMEASALANYQYHPGQIDAIQGDYIDGEHAGQVYWVGTDARLISWAVNTSKTGGNSPATFTDLQDPKFAGQIEMPGVDSDAGYVLVGSTLSNEDEQTGWDTLTAIDKNVTAYKKDDAAPAADAGSGNVGVGVGYDPAVSKAAQSGAQIVFPGAPEMSPYEIDVDALVAKPAPSDAAKAFLDWAISDNAMLAYAADTPITAVDEGNQMPQGYPGTISDQLMQNQDFQYLADNHDKIIAEWTKRFGKKEQ